MFLRNLPIGTKIRERKSGFIFLVAEHGHEGYAETTLIANAAVDYLAYDAAEPDHPNELIAQFGNQDYATSNLHAWLNSEAEDWFSPRHEHDRPPAPEFVTEPVREDGTDGDTFYYDLPYYDPDAKYEGKRAYAEKPGFLTQLAPDFVKMICEVDIPVQKLISPGQTQPESIRALVYLPSLAELGHGGMADEGSRLKLLEDPRYIFIGPDPGVIGKPSDFRYRGASWWYWTRSPFVASYGYGRRISPGHRGGDENDAALGLTSCRNASGVRPMLNLYSGAPVSDVPDQEGIYTFRPSKYWMARTRPPKRWTWTQEVSFNLPEDMKYNPNCPCHNTGCARHGFCKACFDFHRYMDHGRFCKNKEVD